MKLPDPFEPETRIIWPDAVPHDVTQPRWEWWLDDYGSAVALLCIGAGFIAYGVARIL